MGTSSREFESLHPDHLIMNDLHKCTLCGNGMKIGHSDFAYFVKCVRPGCPERIFDFIAKDEDEVRNNWNKRFNGSIVQRT